MGVFKMAIFKKMSLFIFLLVIILTVAACDSDVEELVIQEVENIDDIEVSYGTQADEVIENEFKDTIYVTLSNGESENVKIIWSPPDNYQENVPDLYIFTGTYTIQEINSSIQVEVSLLEKTIEVSSFEINIPEEIDQGDELVVDFLNLKDQFDDNINDKSYDIELNDVLTGQSFIIEAVLFEDGKAENVTILTGSESKITAGTYNQVAFSINQVTITTDITVNAVLAEVKFASVGDVIQGKDLIIDFTEAKDEAGDLWSGEKSVSAAAQGNIDTKTVNFINGEVLGVSFDINTSQLDPGLNEAGIIVDFWKGLGGTIEFDLLGPPTVLHVSTESKGSSASQTIGGGGYEGQMLVETRNVGEFGNQWTIEVDNPTAWDRHLHININSIEKEILITLARMAGQTIGERNNVTHIADAIDGGRFSAIVTSTGYIIYSEGPHSFTGGANIVLEISWNESVKGGNSASSFTLQGQNAKSVTTIAGSNKTVLEFDDLKPLSGGDELIIKTDAVKGQQTDLGSESVSLQWSSASNSWK